MITPVETAFMGIMATATTWPVRFMNYLWPDTIQVSDGGMPIDASGLPLPAIEAHVIAGQQIGYVGIANGKRQYRRLGLLKLYFSVAAGSGTTVISQQIDAVIPFLSRKELYYDALTASRLLGIDTRIDDGAASYEDGNRFVRLVTLTWEFYFTM